MEWKRELIGSPIYTLRPGPESSKEREFQAMQGQANAEEKSISIAADVDPQDLHSVVDILRSERQG